ncbi:MmgE/PrpD family protein [Variovorax paradoxus]|uniref:MmgE/PrpD family protein n=1 Tax=Variovorax paradoxus TaxID=34073 RepID=UPI0021AC139E|nr:MmgE/PrpD family protein [Variovorax paradoxus]UVH60642.1 MmgE/PrpD family protein [Variovorax paradoxus]
MRHSKIQTTQRAKEPMPSHTRQLAEFAAGLQLSDVPPEVVARAKSIVLDGLGCGLFGAHLKWTQMLGDVVQRLEPQGGSTSIWGGGKTASATSAALMNGTMIQGFELDDANPASIHSCAVVLPVVFAAAELIGPDKVDGETLLTAIIAGFEVGPRVGLCMNGNRMLAKGWHTPGLFGAFPAAVAAGRVLGLDSEQIFQALGIAGPQAGGILATQFGSMVKRMLSAKAAQSGLYAALLAAEGFTGIADVFEEEYGGFCTTFTQSTDQFNLSELTDGLGSRWETMRISIKRHACVGTNLSTMDAIEDLMEEGLKAQDVERITVKMTDDAVKHSWWLPYEPVGLTAAQMHLGFCIAMKLIDGEVFVDQMVEENMGRPDLLDFARRVDCVRDESREQRGRSFARGADVEVVLKNGRVIHKVIDHFLGSWQKPMSDEQMAAKYRRLATKSLSQRNVDELERLVRNLEAQPAVNGLVRILHGDSPRPAIPHQPVALAK